MAKSNTYIILRLSSVGDVVMSFVVADALKRKDPKSEVVFVTKPAYASLCGLCPSIDKVIPVGDSLKELSLSILSCHPEAIFDLHANLRTAILKRHLRKTLGRDKIHTYSSHALTRRLFASPFRRFLSRTRLSTYASYLSTLNLLAIHVTNGPPCLIVPDGQFAKAREFREKHGSEHKTLAVFLPFALHETKMWPIERWVETIRYCTESLDMTALCLGTPEEFENFGGPLIAARIPGAIVEMPVSLVELAALIAIADIVVVGDTGPMHIAEGLGKKLVVIFGGTTPSLGFAPANTGARVVEALDVQCRPCSIHGKNSCPKGHFSCMRRVTCDMVIGAIKNIG